MSPRVMLAAGAAAAFALTAASASQAAIFFRISQQPPAGLSLALTNANGVTTEKGQVIRAGDVTVTASNTADFRLVKSKVKPFNGDMLDSVTYTPAAGAHFFGFSFRARDVQPNQTIFVTVKADDQKPQTLSFTAPSNAGATPRLGIVGNGPIKWVQVSTPNGFMKVKNAAFVAASVPEPAAWALMTMGVALAGGSLRSRRRRKLA
ncbi:MAG TPA: PEP-CTERM sorting domain-containing protein [Caulobacteraceae bacterium]|nr:PEP-CTERM sorting domain-containing protein [Caulobacteraceae bacterium]